MIGLAHRDVAVTAPQQMEVAAIKKRLGAHWPNITSILPNASEDTVLEEVNVIAYDYADRITLRETVKLFDTAAATTYKAAAALGALDRRSLLTQVDADQQICCVLRKICDKARQRASSINVKGLRGSGKRQRERAAKQAAAAAARHMLRQAYPERLITVALQVELSEILFEVATGRIATNMRNICRARE